MIGLLTEEIATTPHAGRIILGAQETASKHNLTLAIINSHLSADATSRTDDVRALLDRHVDGIIYATVYHHEVSPPAELDAVPAVLIGARDRRGFLPAVMPDEERGASDVVRLLVDVGHRRIGFASNSEDVPATRGRLRGYLSALALSGIDVDDRLIVSAESEAAGGYLAARALLSISPPPTAIFCYNDRMAMGVYRAAYELGLRIPNDISVVGFDDQDPIAGSLYPQLTTVALPHYEMGAWAVDALKARMDSAGSPEVEVLLRCPVVVRASISPPNPQERYGGTGVSTPPRDP